MTDNPNKVVERISVFFCTEFMAISTGIVINFSTSSALRPGHWVMMVTFVFVTSGNASIGVCLNETTPAMMAITVQKKTKNLFFNEKATILSINLCIVFFAFSLHSKHCRPIIHFDSTLCHLLKVRNGHNIPYSTVCKHQSP